MLEREKNDHLKFLSKCPSWSSQESISSPNVLKSCWNWTLKSFHSWITKIQILEFEMKIRICFLLEIPNWRILHPSDPEEDKNVIIFHSVWKSLKNLIFALFWELGDFLSHRKVAWFSTWLLRWWQIRILVLQYLNLYWKSPQAWWLSIPK